MTLLISIFAVLAGLVFGSFLNVCISRLPRHESIVSPRSRCPRCLTPIRNRDNIPLVSWLLLNGRCRSCRVRIPARYPMVEAVTAALFLLCALEFGVTLKGGGAAVLCWLLLGLAATDAETMLLPDALTLPGIALGVVFSLFSGLNAPTEPLAWCAAAASLLWAAAAAAVILLVRLTYWLVRGRQGIGLGDAKLLAFIAAWLGPGRTAVAFFIGVVSAAAYGVVIVLPRREPGTHSRVQQGGMRRIPLGAFLSGAALFSLFEGEEMLKWYMRFLR